MNNFYQAKNGKRSKGEPIDVIEIIANNSLKRIRRNIGPAGKIDDKKYIAVIYEEEGEQYEEKQ